MDRYLLSSEVFVSYFKKTDSNINDFLKTIDGKQVFISSLTLGIVRDAINRKPASERARFEPSFKDAIKAFEGRIINIDEDISKQWALLRPMKIIRCIGEDEIGEDEKLIIATAMEQGMVYLGRAPETTPQDALVDLGLIVRNPWQDPF